MIKILFLAIAMIAYAANGFASNEVVNTLEDLNINPPATISVKKGAENLEGPGWGICSTVTYRQVAGFVQTEYTGMDGQVYTTTTFNYVITGQCKTCAYIGGNTTECWGSGW